MLRLAIIIYSFHNIDG